MLLSPALWAQEQSGSSKASEARSLQQQIDELKQNQERILKELADLKALLQAPARRADYPVKPPPPSAISVSVGGESFLGDPKAPVAIMEYSDFDCSFCAQYATEIFPLIDAQYIQPGKLKYFFRDLPAPDHTNALFKARVARCAGDQGRFWEMRARLFANVAPLVPELLASHVESLGLDPKAFGDCLASGRFAENIERSVAGAKRMGLAGTPALLLGTLTNGGELLKPTKILIGQESFDTVKTAIEELLGTAPAKAPKARPDVP